jgi:hypothetical protein
MAPELPLGLQRRQRLAQLGAGQPEARRQLPLRRQSIAMGKAAFRQIEAQPR